MSSSAIIASRAKSSSRATLTIMNDRRSRRRPGASGLGVAENGEQFFGAAEHPDPALVEDPVGKRLVQQPTPR
jgi:hypothetical protein